MTVSTCPSSMIRRRPPPGSVASRSGAEPGVEHGGRSIRAPSGSSRAQIASAASAPSTSPDGEETATRASSSRSARSAISAAAGTINSLVATLTGAPLLRNAALVQRSGSLFDGLASGWAWLGPSAGLPRTQRTRRPADGSTARPDAARAQRDFRNVALGARQHFLGRELPRSSAGGADAIGQLAQLRIDRHPNAVQAAQQRDLAIEIVGLDRARAAGQALPAGGPGALAARDL